MKTRTKRASVGVLGLPLIAALAALFIAAFVAFSFARAGPVSAVNEDGISASGTTSGDPANVVQDDGITALQPDTATVVATEPGEVILNYSAIPIIGDGISTAEITFFAILMSIGAIAVVSIARIWASRSMRRRDTKVITNSGDRYGVGENTPDKPIVGSIGHVVQIPTVAGGLQFISTWWASVRQGLRTVFAVLESTVNISKQTALDPNGVQPSQILVTGDKSDPPAFTSLPDDLKQSAPSAAMFQADIGHTAPA